jgi:hypothetical protein
MKSVVIAGVSSGVGLGATRVRRGRRERARAAGAI